jgi:methylated-DNA-[protein]-cysteine S-methyltransferase
MVDMKTPRSTTHHGYADSPIGRLVILTSDDAICGIAVADHDKSPSVPPDSIEGGPLVDLARSQLDEYFSGSRTVFDLPLDLDGTEFQQAVWSALLGVPFGATASYGDIAEAVDRPTAVRAVGAANGANPISIVVPCHRVVGADGSLTGYGWGTGAKRILLDLESANAS